MNEYYNLRILIIKLLLLFIIIPFQILNLILNGEIKVCLCTIGKNENKYVLEFVQHYKKYGIDKIYLYDNNDNNGEKFDEVLKDYIKNGFVEIINFRGSVAVQLKEYQDCYKNNYKKYDWLKNSLKEKYLTNAKEYN